MKTKLISKTISRFAVLSMATLITGCTIFDKTPPFSPTISSFASSSSHNSVDVMIKGEIGSKIFLNGKDSGKKVKKGENKFTLDLSGKDGEKVFSILLVDDAGNKSQAVKVKIIKDTSSPITPTILTKELISKSDKFEITIGGESGSQILVNGKKSNQEIGADGKVKLTLDTTGKDGKKNFTIVAIDKAQNKSQAIKVEIIKDTLAPKTPTTSTTSLVSKSDKFEISLNGEVGSQIILDGKKSGQRIGKDGKAKLILDTSGEDGKKEFKIKLEDNYANVSKELNLLIIKDANPPKAPILKVISKKNSNKIEMEIEAEESSEVFMDKTPLGFIKNGKLRLVFELDGKDGEKNFAFRVKDKVGNISKSSNIKFIKDTTPFAIPTVSYKSLTRDSFSSVLITGEKGSKIIVNGDSRNQLSLGKKNQLRLDLRLKDKDGLNSVEIASIDSYYNISKAVKINIIKDSTPPNAVVLKNVNKNTNENLEEIILIGETGAKLFVNSKEVGIIPKSGKFPLGLDLSGKDGKKEFDFKIKDKAGNESKIHQLTIIKDSTPPKAPINLTKVSKWTNKSKIEIELKGEKDSFIILNGKKSGQIGKDGKGKLTLEFAKKDAENIFSIILQDKFLNNSKATVLKIHKDTIAPKNPKISNTPKASGKDFIHSRVIGEAGSSVILNGVDTELKLNSNGVVTIPLNISGLDGYRTYNFKLKDFANNISEATKITIKKDAIAPTMPIISDIPKATNKNEIDIKIDGEIGSKVFVDSIDSGFILKKDSFFTLELGKDGNKNIEIALVDKANNISKAKSIKILKDTVAPKKPILVGNPKTTKDDIRNITLKGETGCKVFVNGKDTKLLINSTGKIQVPLNTSGLDGNIEFKIKLIDSVGNISETETIIIKKDIKAPSIPILGTIPEKIGGDKNQIEIFGEKGAIVFVNGENTGMIINSSGKVKISLNTSGKDGKKLYKIALVDGAGNVGEAVNVTIAKDTTPPKEVGISLPSLITSADMIEATITGENGNKLFANHSEVGVFKNNTLVALLDLSGKDGKKEFDFSQKDEVGNESKIITATIIKDTVAPQIPTVGEYPTITNKNEVEIDIATKENGTLIINGKEIFIKGKLKTIIDLSGKDGKKIVDIAIKDEAGNISKTLNVNITKDTTPPEIPTAPKAVKITYNNTESIKIKGEAGALVFVNGYNTKMLLNSNGEANVRVGTSGKDGAKVFKITLKDSLKNESKPLILKILKKSK